MEDAVIARAHELTGNVLGGRYEVLGKLGVGGMASVYEGRRVGLHNRVAIKVLRADLCEDPSNVKRFLREARASSVIEHENIVDIVDFGPTDTLPVYFVMEFLEGLDLRQELKSIGRMGWSRARRILLQVVGALGAAHDKAIVHRDVKPANIFLIRRQSGEEVAKVLDFGIAKVVEEQLGGLTQANTMTNGLLGTVSYMAPEQARGGTIDARTDIYAAGVVAYKMLTGEAPFKGNNPYVVLEQHVSEPPVPPRKLVPDIPPEAEAIVLRCLEKAPEKRFQSMHELAEALAHGSTLEYGKGTNSPQAPGWNAPHPAAIEASAAPPQHHATESLGSGSSPRRQALVSSSFPAVGSTQVVDPAPVPLGHRGHGPENTVPSAPRHTVQATGETLEGQRRRSPLMLPVLLGLGVGLGLLVSFGIVFLLEPTEGTTDAAVPSAPVEAPIDVATLPPEPPTEKPEVVVAEPKPVPVPEEPPAVVAVETPDPEVEPEPTAKPRKPRKPRKPKSDATPTSAPSPKRDPKPDPKRDPRPDPKPASTSKPASPAPTPDSKSLHPDLRNPYG
ncbi:MAG: protein kinase domain-containing protein [Nannocystales bacterium]